MPIYEYRCPNGHQFEVFQAISDAPVTECEVCGQPVQRVFHPVAVHFKGSGFYTTDYARKAGAKAPSDGGRESSDSGSDKKPADKKPDAKQTTGSSKDD